MIGIIDFGSCNISSVKNALDFLELKNRIIKGAKDFEGVEKVILPGVGSIASARNQLTRTGLYDEIVSFCNNPNHSILGICLGMQMLYEWSEEDGGIEGLGIIKGGVKKIESNSQFKVPNIGWRKCILDQSNPLFVQIEQESAFYFVHSYKCVTAHKKQVIGQINYSGEINVAVNMLNVFGVQFHPEKSQKCGLQVLTNFALL